MKYTLKIEKIREYEGYTSWYMTKEHHDIQDFISFLYEYDGTVVKPEYVFHQWFRYVPYDGVSLLTRAAPNTRGAFPVTVTYP